MKKIIAIAFALVSMCMCMVAQNRAASLNSRGDNIIGTYKAVQNGAETKVSITKASDGTYTAQVIWVKEDKNKDGSKKLDDKNPDKSLRKVPCDQIVLMKGLKYDSSKKQWGDTKIYDPTRGLRANAKVQFQDDGRLTVKGVVLGISETVYWEKIEK